MCDATAARSGCGAANCYDAMNRYAGGRSLGARAVRRVCMPACVCRVWVCPVGAYPYAASCTCDRSRRSRVGVGSQTHKGASTTTCFLVLRLPHTGANLIPVAVLGQLLYSSVYSIGTHITLNTKFNTVQVRRNIMLQPYAARCNKPERGSPRPSRDGMADARKSRRNA